MYADLPPETRLTITRARLDELHDIALRWMYLNAQAEGGVLQRDGRRRWWLPPEALPEPAATFAEAVDLARAHQCAGCEEAP